MKSVKEWFEIWEKECDGEHEPSEARQYMLNLIARIQADALGKEIIPTVLEEEGG